MKPVLICIVLFFLISASACSVKQSGAIRLSKNFNFSSINTYSTFSRNSPFTDIQSISDTTRNSIEIGIEQIFDKKGFQYEKQSNADVTVSYYLMSGKAAGLKKYNQTVKYCQPCLSWFNQQKPNQRWSLTSGSIVLDVIDNHDKRSIWRGVFPLNIKASDNSAEIQFKIYSALEFMLGKLPNVSS